MGNLIHRIERAVGRISSSQSVLDDTDSLGHYSPIEEKLILYQYTINSKAE